jgi:uncharacterized protein (TIGR02246 family)
MHDDEEAIRQVIAAWLRASASGDTETVLGLMTEDVVFLRPGQPPTCGRAAFAAAQASMGKLRIAANADVQEVRVAGDWAYCWNKLTVTFTPENGGDSTTQTGSVLSIFRRSAGGWQLYRDANMLTAAS